MCIRDSHDVILPLLKPESNFICVSWITPEPMNLYQPDKSGQLLWFGAGEPAEYVDDDVDVAGGVVDVEAAIGEFEVGQVFRGPAFDEADVTGRRPGTGGVCGERTRRLGTGRHDVRDDRHGGNALVRAGIPATPAAGPGSRSPCAWWCCWRGRPSCCPVTRRPLAA